MADMENGRTAEWLDYLISVIEITDCTRATSAAALCAYTRKETPRRHPSLLALQPIICPDVGKGLSAKSLGL